MSETPAPDASPASGEVVAVIATEAHHAAVEAAAKVAVIEENINEAVEEVREDTEDQIAWLTGKFSEHQTALQAMAETLANLPDRIASSVSEALKSMKPEASPEGTTEPAKENESPAAMPEKAVALVAEPVKAVESDVRKVTGIRYL